MWRIIMVACFVLFPPSRGGCEDDAPIPLEALKLDIDALKKWGTRKYAHQFRSKEKPAGAPQPTATWTLVTKFEKDRLLLDDLLSMSVKGHQASSIHWKAECSKNNQLSLKALDCEEQTRGTTRRKIHAIVETEKAMITYEQGDNTKKESVEWSAGSVTVLAMFRIVTLLPREKGKRYRIANVSRSRRLRMRGEHIIECMGPDASAGRAQQWVKFELKNLDGKPPSWTYWVDDDGVLQRVLIERHTLILIKE